MNLFATSVSLFCEVLRDLSKIRKLTDNMFSVVKVTLESQMSVHLSVTKTPQPLRIAPIDH